MFEHRSSKLAPPAVFVRRLAFSVLVAGAVIVVSLVGCMIGYHVLEDLAWLDAFTNASMVLSGMGPLATLKTSAGKVFAGLYAI